MMSYIKVYGDECGTTDKNNPLDLKDGHFYYINVRAFNKAGLSSLATSWAFKVDTTPPMAGYVYDGNKSQLTGNIKDIDYQTETEILNVYWEGFYESHSTIRDYYVSIGTCPQCEDILIQQAIGIAYEITEKNIHLGPGLKYYATVTACNTADMCTTVTSDGVVIDNSPPTAGIVQDGTGYYNNEYQSMTNYISAKWFGFDDSQSGLEKYIWRAGTTVGGNDIVSETELHLTETVAVYDTSLGLPINQRIFVTVRAYNKAGLWSESTSNGFIIDTTPPVIKTPPTFSVDFGINGLTQIDSTTMKIEWDVEDTESYIKRQFLSIKSHMGGEFMLSSHDVNGIARSYVFTGLDLHDGVTYYVTLIACNGAEMCNTSTSPGMLVDSSPPSRGMFAVTTDHASDPDLARYAQGWMMWSTHQVYLAWLGFKDVHTGIDYYKVEVGSTYMANDLSKDTSTIYTHTDVNTDHGDEGKVQLFTVETHSLTNVETIFVTVWAVNKVGLRSHLIHSAFTKTPGGSLDIVRRCDVLSCDGHCVCAPQDQKCPYSAAHGSCNDLTGAVENDNRYSLLLVRDTNGYSITDQAVTASNNVLRGLWLVSQVQAFKPLWYEWSVGYSDYSTPLGIYHLSEEKGWQDAGQLTDTIFTISKAGKFLHNGKSYSMFVRVWYSSNTYAVFKSNGIYVMTKPPSVTFIRGKIVTERVQGTTVKDQDFMKIGRPIEFNWNGKFLAANTTIEKYRLYLSTFPGGHDILNVDDVIPGTAMGYNMSRINLTPGVVHYSNVIAYNYAGAHTTSSSDGFMVDHTSPSAGIVYDGIGREDIEYQNSSNTVASRWHGFIDTESGIRSYHWCVGVTSQYGKSSETECSVLPWTYVGLHNSVSRNLSADLQEGTKIYNKVYATDGVGWTSQIVVSDGVNVDTSAPIPEKFVYFYENLIVNPSFEETYGGEVEWSNVSSTDICSMSTFYHPTSWILQTGSCMAVVSSATNLARDGANFLFIRGYFSQHLDNVKSGLLYRISFFTSHLSIKASAAANKEGFVQLGGDHTQIFILYTRSYRHDGHGEDETREEISWHDHTFFIRATEDNATLTIGSVDITTGIFIDDLSVQEVNLTTGHTSGHVLGHVVYLHDWSSIHGSWNFIDTESPIIDYEWAIGYSEGGTQIQPFRSVGLMNFGDNFNVTLVHNSYIYITALAINAAGLKAEACSDRILVDLTPPNIMYVYDGRGADEDAWTFNEVAANWVVEDLESGIKFCRWAIGYSPGTTELLPYTDISTSEAYMDFPYSVLEGHKVYTTVSCENEAGLSSTLSSNGVRISNTPPSTITANVETVPLSQTEYTPSNGFSGRSDEIRLKWSGFTDPIGIQTFEVNKGDSQTEKMFFPEQQEVLYTHFTKMSLIEDVHTVTVRAINKLFLRSAITTTNMTVCTVSPMKDDTKSLAVSWINNEIVVSWTGVFVSDDPLFYEISAGTKEAGINIIQWQYTNQTSITFGIPPTIEDTTGLNVHITVSAVTVGGFSQFETGTILLP